MAKLTDKQEQIDWSSAKESMSLWHEEIHRNMTNEKFIELYVGNWAPSAQKKMND
jgi:hypothetical protein